MRQAPKIRIWLLVALLLAECCAQCFPVIGLVTAAQAAPPRATTKNIVPAKAKKKYSLSPARRRRHGRRPMSAADYARRFAALVVDADSGQILYEVNAGETRHPASLTKMMTLYLLFEAMSRGKVSTDTLMPVSDWAADQPPTNIALTQGDRITVETAIKSLVVRSANDSAVVVAEALGGSQQAFADMMNQKAKQLGMNATEFYNPSGLPDTRQVTCAYDMARLGIALRRDFPQYYRYFSVQEFSFRGRQYEGHNRLIGRYPGADGVKTGYIGSSGFNLVTSVRRGSTKLVGVIMGGRTASSRDQQMMDMLDTTFSNLAHGGRPSAVRDEEKPLKKRRS